MKIYLALNVLEDPDLVQRSGATADVHVGAERVAECRIYRSLLVDLLRLADVLRRNVGPLLGEADHGAGVHQTVAEFVGHLPLDAVENPSGLLLEGSGPRGQNDEILHVAPGEARIRLEGQSSDTGCEWRRRRSSGVLDGAYVIGTKFSVHVNGRDALVVARCTGRVRRRQRRAALLEIPGLVTALGRARYRQGKYAVSVAVAVARIRVATAVTRGPDEDRASTLPTLYKQHCLNLLDEAYRRRDQHFLEYTDNYRKQVRGDRCFYNDDRN